MQGAGLTVYGKKGNLERDKRMERLAAVRAKLPDWLRVFGLFRAPQTECPALSIPNAPRLVRLQSHGEQHAVFLVVVCTVVRRD